MFCQLAETWLNLGRLRSIHTLSFSRNFLQRSSTKKTKAFRLSGNGEQGRARLLMSRDDASFVCQITCTLSIDHPSISSSCTQSRSIDWWIDDMHVAGLSESISARVACNLMLPVPCMHIPILIAAAATLLMATCPQTQEGKGSPAGRACSKRSIHGSLLDSRAS